MSETSAFLELPYIDRQKVIFVENALYEALNQVSVRAEEQYNENILAKIFKVAWRIIPRAKNPSDITIETMKKMMQTYEKSRAIGLGVQMAPKRWIPQFDLSPGHPRDRVLYAAHPAVSTSYIPIADFHRFTFEHKFSEILSILMHLGAKKVHVEHVCGWGHDFASKLSVGIPQAKINVGVSANKKSETSRRILYEAELEGSKSPELPDSLVWYKHEPTWQKVSEGRLRFGLKKFSLKLQYQDDYGVNAGLKIKAQKVGLDLGGDFQNHESTTWSINGEF